MRKSGFELTVIAGSTLYERTSGKSIINRRGFIMRDTSYRSSFSLPRIVTLTNAPPSSVEISWILAKATAGAGGFIFTGSGANFGATIVFVGGGTVGTGEGRTALV
jgi:hypothetical protein